LEIDVNNHKELKDSGAEEIFKDYTEIRNNYYDFILLCNVLHEIPLLEWENTLNKIIDALRFNGYIVIIEANRNNNV
jgi:hypothetical protein